MNLLHVVLYHTVLSSIFVFGFQHISGHSAMSVEVIILHCIYFYIISFFLIFPLHIELLYLDIIMMSYMYVTPLTKFTELFCYTVLVQLYPGTFNLIQCVFKSRNVGKIVKYWHKLELGQNETLALLYTKVIYEGYRSVPILF